MTPTATESTTLNQPTCREWAADAMPGVAKISREAQALKTLATDAVEDGLHAARRTVRKAQQRALDTRDDLTYRVKRQPLAAVAVAFGAGTLVGFLLGLAGRRARSDQSGPEPL